MADVFVSGGAEIGSGGALEATGGLDLSAAWPAGAEFPPDAAWLAGGGAITGASGANAAGNAVLMTPGEGLAGGELTGVGGIGVDWTTAAVLGGLGVAAGGALPEESSEAGPASAWRALFATACSKGPAGVAVNSTTTAAIAPTAPATI